MAKTGNRFPKNIGTGALTSKMLLCRLLRTDHSYSTVKIIPVSAIKKN